MYIFRLVMLLILFTSLIGGVMYVTWFLMSFLLSKYQKACNIYTNLKFAAFGYFLPFVGLACVIRAYYKEGSNRFFPILTIQLQRMLDFLLCIYVIGVVITLTCCLLDYLQFVRICRKSFSVPKCYYGVLETVKKQLNIKKNIKICQGYNIVSPCIIGIVSPCIYLPLVSYSEEQLKLSLLHELSHYKQNDLLWKPIFMMLCTIYWFNPLVWILFNQQRKWAEVTCDFNCCENGFSKKVYFSLLLELEENSVGRYSCWVPTLVRNHKELKWRICCMKKMKDNLTKKRNIWLCSCLSLLVGICMVVFMSYHVEAAYNQYVEDGMEEVADKDENELEEYEMSAEEVAKLNIVQERPLPYMPLGTRNINWTVNNGVTYASGMFYPTNGSTVSAAVSVSPSGKTISLGLLQPNGVMKYVSGSGNFSHTFSVTQSGAHKICVVNNSGVTVTVTGFYAY